MRGGLRGEGGVVSTPDATSIAGVTPTAAGLALLDDATTLAQRATLTAQGGAWRTTSSGTDTLVAGDGVVEYTASCTITLPSAAASGVFVGKTITLIAATAGIVLTLQRAGSDTLNGDTATVAATMGTVRSTLAVVAQSSSAWGSLQPGSLTINGLRWYAEGGLFYARAVNVSRSAAGVQVVADLGSAVAATTANPDAYTAAVSGADIVVDAGTAGVSGALGTHAQRWGWTMAALGITLPTTTFRPNVSLEVTSVTGTRGGLALHLLAGFGTSQTAPQRATGIYVNSTPGSATIGYAYLVSAGGGVVSNGTGATTMTGCINSQNMIIAANPIYWITRLDSGVAAATTTFTSAPAVSAAPTDFVLYLNLDAVGPLTNAITFTAPVGLVWW